MSEPIVIPYAAETRPDTGVTNASLGMWLFIASEVMLFGSLFSAYALLRSGAPSWPDQSATLNVPLASINTLILVASSVAITRAARAIGAGALPRFRALFGTTIVCGLVFLLLKSTEYRAELLAGLRPATNNFLGLYFTLTGLHALHLICGVVVNAWLWLTVPAMHAAEPARAVSRIRTAALYWNFVDLVWLIMFPLLYLL